MDEAHSIGALGRTGRGICDEANVNPDDIDILMGTFTKSFGAVGGYIAGSMEMINYLRHVTAGSLYSSSISIPACQQIISALKIIMGEDGTDLGNITLLCLSSRIIANLYLTNSQSCLMFVVCCLLFVVCCLLFVVCCLLFVV